MLNINWFMELYFLKISVAGVYVKIANFHFFMIFELENPLLLLIWKYYGNPSSI